jgi:hypothetical protein
VHALARARMSPVGVHEEWIDPAELRGDLLGVRVAQRVEYGHGVPPGGPGEVGPSRGAVRVAEVVERDGLVVAVAGLA